MVRLLGEEVVEVTEGELAEILERAEDHPVVLERDGIRYRIVREGPAKYDPERAREAMRNAGTLVGVDPEELIERIYRARREGSGLPEDA